MPFYTNGIIRPAARFVPLPAATGRPAFYASIVLGYHKLKAASETGAKPDALGRKLYH